MKHTESTFTTHDGLTLHCQHWLPDRAPRASIVIVHGFGEHSGCYDNLVTCLIQQEVGCHAFDLRGHGRSPGRRGHIQSWSEYREDVRAYLEWTSSLHDDIPLFLYGHSMGGLIVLEYVSHYPDDVYALIASAPILGEIGVSPALQLLGRMMSRIWPSFSLDVHLDRQALSRDEDVVESTQKDPLAHSIGSARLGTEIHKARKWVHAHAPQFTLPLLILQGDADRITPPDGTRDFYQKVPPGRKTYLEYAGGYHELHNDIDHERVLSDLSTWIDQQLKLKTEL